MRVPSNDIPIVKRVLEKLIIDPFWLGLAEARRNLPG